MALSTIPRPPGVTWQVTWRCPVCVCLNGVSRYFPLPELWEHLERQHRITRAKLDQPNDPNRRGATWPKA